MKTNYLHTESLHSFRKNDFLTKTKKEYLKIHNDITDEDYELAITELSNGLYQQFKDLKLDTPNYDLRGIKKTNKFNIAYNNWRLINIIPFNNNNLTICEIFYRIWKASKVKENYLYCVLPKNYDEEIKEFEEKIDDLYYRFLHSW